MSELNQDELSILKARADLLGIAYHPSIGVEKLKEKVNSALAEKPKEASYVAVAQPTAKELESAMLERIRDEQLALKRIRLTCMNPSKSEWPGEVITSGNALTGTVSKYVPFNADDGWHVPQIILDVLTERQCQVFVTVKTKNGVSIKQGKLIREFAIEVLPPLTAQEMSELARRQVMAQTAD